MLVGGEGGVDAVRAWYLLAKVWELDAVSTPGELERKQKLQTKKGAPHTHTHTRKYGNERKASEADLTDSF